VVAKKTFKLSAHDTAPRKKKVKSHPAQLPQSRDCDHDLLKRLNPKYSLITTIPSPIIFGIWDVHIHCRFRYL
jgi:hypothetical protein